MDRWTPVELAYFAGVIDGEGSFCLKNQGTHRFSCQLQVGNTDLRMLQWIEARFSGSVRIERRPNVKHKTVWRWWSNADNLTDVITALLPFLITKRDQAELMLAYRRTLSPKINSKRSTSKTSEAVKLERAEIHSQLAVLNRRGA